MLSETPDEHAKSSASAEDNETSFCVLLAEYSMIPDQKITTQETDLRVPLSEAQSLSV